MAPARPPRPRLVRPKEIPRISDSPLPKPMYLLHNLAHIELNAIDLAWDTVVRFSHMRLQNDFYGDFARVADDESRHFGWCLQRMAECGHGYGDMDAHDMLWDSALKSKSDLCARLAIIPMSQEARGLDAGPRLVRKLTGLCDVRSSKIVARIAQEEKAHVAVGVAWFTRVCDALGEDPGCVFRAELAALCPDLLKGPFNHEAREEVGLQRGWYDRGSWVDGSDGGGGLDEDALCTLRQRLGQILEVEMPHACS
ncbi:unnamed protein product [Ostreobium quekettii]|uniref:Ferritin-like superfamily n=1 Tax=Ostreobium quekettii TaxID=121088 RepID=A0A8S1J413_9CHLO|nr:unnamed protein product [Ostreobium quekettii]|eukprot:evm.model.scf_131.16 EVM.evm.TU.scf_131.16   scf_131:110248-111479(-)